MIRMASVSTAGLPMAFSDDAEVITFGRVALTLKHTKAQRNELFPRVDLHGSVLLVHNRGVRSKGKGRLRQEH